MGPEPLDENFTLEKFKGLLKERKGRIKGLLMDQKFIAGIGNIYGDEILFQAAIRPERRVDTLTAKEVKLLYEKIRKVLTEACYSYEEYLSLSQRRDWLMSTRHKGFCPRDQKELGGVKIQGRYSYYCSECQR